MTEQIYFIRDGRLRNTIGWMAAILGIIGVMGNCAADFSIKLYFFKYPV